MSLEKAIEIFKGHQDPQWIIESIQQAESLGELQQIIRESNLSAGQFISFRMVAINKGDPKFAEKTLDDAKRIFSKYSLPEEIIDYFFREVPESLSEIALSIELKMLPKVENENELKRFYDEASEYLFRVLKNYVTPPH